MTRVPPRPAPGGPARPRAGGARPLGAEHLRPVGRATRDGEPWTFYEGPPTANGMPGTHHVEARVFKDVFPRFRTMRGRYVARKGGWDCHGLPVELAVEKELGFSGKADIEAFGVAEFNARCRESVLRHVDAFEQMTDADGLLGRHRESLPDHGPGVHRVGVVGAQADPRQGPARGGLPGGAVLPALRHRALRPRARAGLRDRHRPVGLRAVPADRAGRTPAPTCYVDHDAVDAGVQRAGRGAPGVDLRHRHRRRGDAGGRGVDGRERCWRRRAERVDVGGSSAGTWWAGPTSAPSTWSSGPTAGRTSSSPRTTSPPRTAPAWCTSRPRSARTTSLSCRRNGVRDGQPDRHDRALRRRACRLVGGQFFRHANTDLVADLESARPALPARPLRAQLPALLALPHRAALLRPAVVVRPHHRVKDALLRENERHQLVPRHDQVGPLRRLAEQQHRLGALAQPVLGHAAADLALRRGPPDLRGVARRSCPG